MSFTDFQKLKQTGFTGFKTIAELTSDSSGLPNSPAVYMVLNLKSPDPDFLTTGTGGYFKGKDPNVSLEVLKANWVDDTIVVYIGKATSLRSRLGQYFSFGHGMNVGHYGGRYVWQLRNSGELVVCWKNLTSVDPKVFEADLIKQFVMKYGKRPFANLND